MMIHHGGNGGYQAINLAFHFGATRMILIGYDMQNTGGKSHWHGDHEGLPNPTKGAFKQWIQRFERLATDLKGAGVEVFNATTHTSLTAFPRASIDRI